MDIFLRGRSCKTEDDINAWYPPGHGDFYQVLASLGPVTFFLAVQDSSIRDNVSQSNVTFLTKTKTLTAIEGSLH